MKTIKTTLTTSGNSIAVRLPKELLQMSGLEKAVTLEARDGEIVIRKSISPREDWGAQIAALQAKLGDPSQEFATIASDDMDDAPWDGIPYEEWCKAHDGHA